MSESCALIEDLTVSDLDLRGKLGCDFLDGEGISEDDRDLPGFGGREEEEENCLDEDVNVFFVDGLRKLLWDVSSCVDWLELCSCSSFCTWLVLRSSTTSVGESPMAVISSGKDAKQEIVRPRTGSFSFLAGIVSFRRKRDDPER